MTLDEALAEVKRAKAEDNCNDKTVEALDMICTAATSGELIPKADHDLAVALVVQKAGDIILNSAPRAHWLIREDILALAPADALAEVQALQLRPTKVSIDVSVFERLDAAEAEVQELKAERDALRKQLISWMRVAREEHAKTEVAEAEVARLRSLIGRYGWNVIEAEGVGFMDGSFTTAAEASEISAMIDEARELLPKDEWPHAPYGKDYTDYLAALTPKGDTP